MKKYIVTAALALVLGTAAFAPAQARTYGSPAVLPVITPAPAINAQERIEHIFRANQKFYRARQDVVDTAIKSGGRLPAGFVVNFERTGLTQAETASWLQGVIAAMEARRQFIDRIPFIMNAPVNTADQDPNMAVLRQAGPNFLSLRVLDMADLSRYIDARNDFYAGKTTGRGVDRIEKLLLLRPSEVQEIFSLLQGQ